MKKVVFLTLSSLMFFLSLTKLSFAETTMSAEGQYIFNSLGFYIGGVLVAFMAAGFCMLESGLVTTRSVSSIAAKNIGKFAIGSIVFFLVGYNLAYDIPEGGFIGSFSIWTDTSNAETGYSGYSDWFYQTMFVCATVSIVSGAVAERIKIWPFFFFAAIMAGFIYPISMGWRSSAPISRRVSSCSPTSRTVTPSSAAASRTSSSEVSSWSPLATTRSASRSARPSDADGS